MNISGGTYSMGHLNFPILFEWVNSDRGNLKVVDEFMQKDWALGTFNQTLQMIKWLKFTCVDALSMQDVKIQPLLDTLRQWFEFEGENAGETYEVKRELGNALAYTWLSFPDIVENYLEDENELRMHMYESLRVKGGELQWGQIVSYNNLLTALLFNPSTVEGLIEVVQTICESITDIEEALSMLGNYLMASDTLEALAEQ